MAEMTCYEAVAGLEEPLRATLPAGHNYYVLGGIATGAIKHPGSEFCHADRAVIAAKKSGEALTRENGTMRDIDVLVDKVLDEAEAAELVRCVAENSGGLEASVFGFEKREIAKGLGARAVKSVKTWVLDRTLDEDGVKRLELYPLEQVASDESFEPWKLVLPGATVDIFNPAGHMLAYAMRSISGIRYKDVTKVAEMRDQVMSDPQFEAEIREGEFKPWIEFASGLFGLRKGTLPPDSPLLADDASQADLLAFRAKGQTLRFLESQEKLIKFAQTGPGAKLLNVFVKAK